MTETCTRNNFSTLYVAAVASYSLRLTNNLRFYRLGLRALARVIEKVILPTLRLAVFISSGIGAVNSF